MPTPTSVPRTGTTAAAQPVSAGSTASGFRGFAARRPIAALLIMVFSIGYPLMAVVALAVHRVIPGYRLIDRLPIPPDRPVAYVTQTTLSVDDTRATIEALRRRFTDIQGPDTRDICYATQNRQSAVRDLSKVVDVILVVGAKNSSNSNRLREIGTEEGIPSYLIADATALQPDWLRGAATVGITAGASAPEALVQEVIAAIALLGPVEVSTMGGIVEDVQFKLPAALLEPEASAAL